jgi:hypothetical protein
MELDTGSVAPEATVETGDTAPVADSTVTSDVGDSGEVQAPAAEYVDFDTLGSHLTKVQVGGEEIEVSLADLRGGYMRQADYTRKTQELAKTQTELRQAQALAAALERDPQGTLAALQQAYGVVYEQQGEFDPDYEPDPLELELQELKQWKAEITRERETERINGELSHLHSEHGEFDDVELLTFAVQNGIRDLGTAYQAMRYPVEQAARAKAEAEARVIAEKRTQLAGVETGGHRGSDAVPQVFDSFRDAYLAAKQSS